MEIKDALPFDESIASDVVIADPESLDANCCTELFEKAGDLAASFK
jgi:hypothetical protein